MLSYTHVYDTFWKNWKRNTYVEMILIAFTGVIEDNNFIYQNDNAPVHASRHTYRLEKIYKI